MGPGDPILELLASEADRRVPVIAEGAKSIAAGADFDGTIEGMRAEAHGLKGAAAVVEQVRLAEVASAIEKRLIAAGAVGALATDDARTIAEAAEAFRRGAHAAMAGEDEPPSVGEALSRLG